MNLMFWKKKADTGENAENIQENSAESPALRESHGKGSPDPESPDPETLDKPSLAARMKLRLAALIWRFKKPPAFQAEEDQAHDDSGHSESTTEDTSPPEPVNLKKRLILGSAIGLAILLLSGLGFAVWKIFLSTSKHDADTSAPAEISHTARPVPHAEAPSAEINVLKKKNDELQAQVEALKKEQLQPVTPTVQQASDNIRSQSVSGEITIDNKDPKATAMSLKEAIEAMNAGSGDDDEGNAK